MKTIKINIPEWTDIKKWFWDLFFFPRRKAVAQWLIYHNSLMASMTEKILIKYQGQDLTGDSYAILSKAINEWRIECKSITEKTENLIMKTK